MEPDPARDWPWAVMWFLVFIFAAWPLSFIFAFIYVILLPFSVCMKSLQEPIAGVLRIMHLPLTCVEGMMTLKPMCMDDNKKAANSKDVVVQMSKTPQSTESNVKKQDVKLVAAAPIVVSKDDDKLSKAVALLKEGGSNPGTSSEDVANAMLLITGAIKKRQNPNVPKEKNDQLSGRAAKITKDAGAEAIAGIDKPELTKENE